ncbi:MAG: hypothetical protein PHY45_11655 [Rhodocyclaceae bacterium]|nr:hypothetical protein [Rhodocyclaceae bacterium]
MLLPLLVVTLPDIGLLPPPIVTGYGFVPDDGTVRTDMDTGSARVRGRFTSIPDTYSVTWRLKASELADFRTWFRDTAAAGAAWFPLTLADGSYGIFGSHQCRFVGTYKPTLVSNLVWEVKASLEVRNA